MIKAFTLFCGLIIFSSQSTYSAEEGDTKQRVARRKVTIVQGRKETLAEKEARFRQEEIEIEARLMAGLKGCEYPVRPDE